MPETPPSPDSGAETLNKLISVRGSHRGYVTKKSSDAQVLVNKPELSELEKDELHVVKDLLTSRLSLLDELNKQIQEKLSIDELEHEIQECSNREGEIMLMIRKITKKVEEAPTTPVFEEPPRTAQYHTQTHLPKLNITKFDGDPKNFQSFWDIYSATVDQNPSLNTIQKVAYLKSLCSGSAASAIAGIRNTSDQYHVMVETLKSRFDRKAFVRDNHLHELLNLKRVTNHNSIKCLRDLYNSINNHLSALESVGLVCDKEALLGPIIINALPERIQEDITKEYGGDEDITVHKIMDHLLRYVESRERFNSLTNKSEKSPVKKVSAKKPSDVPKQPSFAFFASSSVKSSGRKPKCPFCEKNGHIPSECTNVKSRSQRLRIIRERRICFNCLGFNHLLRDCSSKSTCFHCKARHHTSICEWQQPWKTEPHPSFPVNQQEQSGSQRNGDMINSSAATRNNFEDSGQSYQPHQSSTTNNGNNTPHVTNFAQSKLKKPHIFLQTAVADILNPISKKVARIRILFDEGSMHSYVSNELAEFLQLPIIDKQYCEIQTFGNAVSKTVLTNTVQLQLKKGNFVFSTDMYTSDYICQPVPNVNLNNEAINELRDIQLADPFLLSESELPVSMLIGCDKYWDFILPDMFKTKSGPMAVQSKLGYLLSGPVNFTVSPAYFNILTSSVNFISHLSLSDNFTARNEHELDFKLDQFFNLESLGILPESQEATIIEEFENSIEYFPEKKRYRVRLPWRDSMRSRLPSYRGVAEKRLDSLCKKLQKIEKNAENEIEVNIVERYQSVIDQQESEGIIVKVDNINNDNSNVMCFLPHRCVIKPHSSSSPIRIVLDGSVKFKGNSELPSLNECLLAGPSLIKDLCKLLTQFRLKPVALVCDIEKAYLNLELHPEDQEAVMFLWKSLANQAEPTLVYKFQRVAFGLTSSPFLLMAALNFHFKKFENLYPVAREIKDKFYMDDLVLSVGSSENAISLLENSEKLLSLASMNLKKWNSNATEVRAYLKCNTSEELPSQQKVLGLNWDVSCDTLSCVVMPVLELAQSVSPTKRNILSVVASVFDPMGILGPFMLPAKGIFQALCKHKISWDEILPNSLLVLWQDWIFNLSKITNMTLPRYIFQGISFENENPNDIEIHAFSDASMQGYCSVIYLRVRDQFGNFHTKFFISKTRIAPLKKLTLPRLELLGALLSVRLVDTVMKFLCEFSISQICFYTDSLNVLHWVKSPQKMWGVFIMHRLREIRKLSQVSDWHFVPGKLNPSDIGTRKDIKITPELYSLWFDGPSFLRDNIDITVNDIDVSLTPDCIIEEEKRVNCVNVVVAHDNNVNISNCININHYSTYQKLINVTFYVLKAVSCFKKSKIDLSELKAKSENLWFQAVQLTHFPIECKYVSRNVNVKVPACEKTATPLIKQLQLFKDENGVLRVRTRFENAHIPYDSKYPKLLPKNSHLTKLIVLDRHERLFHSGVSHTLNQVRQEFYFPTGRRVVRNILGGCLVCVRLKANPYLPKNSPTLPDFRVAQETAFSFVFVDFMGPIYVKSYDSKNALKSYVAVFTCAVTRGVILELVSNLTVSCFFLALRRFISQCGRAPKIIVSDNAKTYKSTAKELSILLNPEVLHKFCMSHRLEWRFNLPLSPWWGGAVERIVSLVKNALRSTLSRALLSYEEIQTTLAEIQIVLNTRPLTYVSDQITDNAAITPSTLMYGNPVSCLPPVNLIKPEFIPLDSQFSSRRLKYLERLQNEFWSRFTKEYFNFLSESHFISRSRADYSNKFPKKGDIVLLKENNKKRYQWKIGRIENVFEGRDGKIRSLEIRPTRLNNADKRIPETIKRSPQMCVPLELDISEKQTKVD